MFTIRKKFRVEMAHQLIDSYTKACRLQHGHSYIIEVFLSGKELDSTGMLVDFTKISDKIKPYIMSWDHCLVMNEESAEEYLDMLKKYNCNMKIVPYNPTAENMAKDMFDTIKKEIPQLSKVRVHETETGWAEYYE